MVVHVTYVFPFVVVKASVFGAVRCRERLATILSLEDVEVEDLVVLQYLCLLVVEQIFAQVHDDVARLHRELDFERSFLIVREERLASDCTVTIPPFDLLGI